MCKLFCCIVMVGVFSAHAALGASVPELKRMIEGFYVLEEWHMDGRVERPPRVDGRFVLKEGAVITVLLNNANETDKTSTTLFGSFVLDETSFSFRYDTRSSFRETASGISRLPPPASAGMRKFYISAQGTALHLKSDQLQQEFLLENDMLTYSENGKVLRVWRRLSP
jgi:hypothetical protein